MDDEQQVPTPDDALEAERANPLNYTVGDQPLPEDNDSPAAPASDTGEPQLPAEHPTHDTDIDDDEHYAGEV